MNRAHFNSSLVDYVGSSCVHRSRSLRHTVEKRLGLLICIARHCPECPLGVFSVCDRTSRFFFDRSTRKQEPLLCSFCLCAGVVDCPTGPLTDGGCVSIRQRSCPAKSAPCRSATTPRTGLFSTPTSASPSAMLSPTTSSSTGAMDASGAITTSFFWKRRRATRAVCRLPALLLSVKLHRLPQRVDACHHRCDKLHDIQRAG